MGHLFWIYGVNDNYSGPWAAPDDTFIGPLTWDSCPQNGVYPGITLGNFSSWALPGQALSSGSVRFSSCLYPSGKRDASRALTRSGSTSQFNSNSIPFNTWNCGIVVLMAQALKEPVFLVSRYISSSPRRSGNKIISSASPTKRQTSSGTSKVLAALENLDCGAPPRDPESDIEILGPFPSTEIRKINRSTKGKASERVEGKSKAAVNTEAKLRSYVISRCLK